MAAIAAASSFLARRLAIAVTTSSPAATTRREPVRPRDPAAGGRCRGWTARRWNRRGGARPARGRRYARSPADPTSRATTSHGAAGATWCRGNLSRSRAAPSALVFPEPVAAPVKPHDPAVGESVGDLRARSVARGTPDHADRGIGRDVPRRRRGPPGLRRQWRDDARQDAGVHPLTDHPGDVLFIHVVFHLSIYYGRASGPASGRQRRLRRGGAGPWVAGAVAACFSALTDRRPRLTFEDGALVDDQDRRLQIAVDTRRSPQLDSLGRDDAADDLSFDDHDRCVKPGLDPPGARNAERARGANVPLDPAVQDDAAAERARPHHLGAFRDEGGRRVRGAPVVTVPAHGSTTGKGHARQALRQEPAILRRRPSGAVSCDVRAVIVCVIGDDSRTSRTVRAVSPCLARRGNARRLAYFRLA